MTRVLYIFFLMLTALILQMLAGNLGLALPLAGITVFYLAFSYGWQPALVLGVIAGTIIDVIYGEMRFSAVLFSLWAIMGAFWRKKIPGKSGSLDKLFPGLIIAAVSIIPFEIQSGARFEFIWQWNRLISSISHTVFMILLSALLTPLIFLLFESFGKFIGVTSTAAESTNQKRRRER